MKKRTFKSRMLAVFTAAAAVMTGLPGQAAVVNAAQDVDITSTLTVDMTAQTGDILHGASGFLYGISNEDVPTTNTLVPLKPKVLATKGALGTEHPYGDALDVAETFLASGGEQVMMYNSNYYGVFGVTADYKDYSAVLKDTIAPYIYRWKQEWKQEHGTPEDPKDELGKTDIDKAIIYIPINEGTPVNGAPDTNIAWKSYYDAIKAGDPDATIAGPNSCGYNLQFVNTDFRGHIQYCADNDCMPDIITWHELDTDDLQGMSGHMDDFNNIWETTNWTKWNEKQGTSGIPQRPQIVINEYAEMKDCGVPGALVNWIARLEDEKIYGCLPFWQQANNLNGLTSDANEGAGAWWVYKWYGDMSGKTLQVQTSTRYDRLYGVASIDDNKQSASVLMGGEDGTQKLLLKNLDKTTTFRDKEKVHIAVQKTSYKGYAGTVSAVPTILEGTFPVAEDGSVEITIPNAKYADAFFVTVTNTTEENISDPLVSRYSETYEAEHAKYDDLFVKKRADYSPTYYFSDGHAVLMDEKACELTYEFEVPVDGKYQLDFLYGNGTGSSRNDMDSHKPLNVKQSYRIDQGEAEEVIMENTLFTAITDCYTKYADLKAGKHSVTITSMEDADVIHDALLVAYAGAYGEELPEWSGIYEAEQADFNMLADCSESKVLTKTEKSGYSGNGYVTGLNEISVPEGGGIRWNVVVEESGIYNVTLRYQSSAEGQADIYVGNTTTTLDSLSKSLAVSDTEGAWKRVTASIYLQKGINIIDTDADTDIALDYMKVQKVPEEALETGRASVIEAEDCVPEGSTIQVKDSEGASGGQYVVGYEGDENAASDKNKYLEFTYEAPAAGIYELQVFQSNDDICGSHSYNIKIIDKYATIQVTDAQGRTTGANRYFFINTSSDDTFKEKSVKVRLEKGKNTIKIFNDDSWQVKWGGTQSTPGTNELDNFTPNFDKFVLTPMALENAAEVEETYPVKILTTAGGYAVSDKNEVSENGSARITMLPDKGVDQIFVNGTEKTDELTEKDGHYTLELNNIREEQKVVIFFEEGSGEYIDPYIKNASFGTKDLTGWNADAESTKVHNANADSYEGYYVQISEGTLTQEVTGIPEGEYILGIYSKASGGQTVTGKAVLEAKGQSTVINAGAVYEENYLRVKVAADGKLTIKVDATELEGTICMDQFALTTVPERDASEVNELMAYFVDCGDHNPETLSAGDAFGTNNSVTDQLYKVDKATGYAWGVVTSEEDQALYQKLDAADKAAYTEYQRANNWELEDGAAKTVTFRYAHNQRESGINPRYIKYQFELDPDEYLVSICMGNTWNNAGNPQLYLNDTEITGEDFAVAPNANAVASGKIDLTNAQKNENGRVVLEIRAQSTDPTIQMNYITIAPYREYADVSELRAVYDKVKTIKEEGYTKASWSVFQTALKKAEELLGTENLPFDRQLAVNEAKRALDSAAAALVKLSDIQDPDLLYFVDCGDHDPATLTRKDKFGIYNSVTDQIYGPDAETGKSWGVLTAANDGAIPPGIAGDKAVYTEFQRADVDIADGKNKKTTFRYAHNQLEAGISPRYVKYQFEVEAGSYEVDVCMGNTWGNSGNPDIYLNQKKINDTELSIGQGSNKIVTGTIKVAEGETLQVYALSQDPTINMNYIMIRRTDDISDPVIPELPEVLADFNFDTDGNAFIGGNAKATGAYTLADHGTGKALQLNGNSQFLTVTDKEGGNLLTGVDEMTVSYQINPKTGRTNWGFFAAPNDNIQQFEREQYVGIVDIDGTTKAERYNGGPRPVTAEYATGYNGWYHVTVVYTANETKLYINGEKVSEQPSTFALRDILGYNSILYIGKSNWTENSEYATAMIDNYKIYSKALTDAEVAAEAVKYVDKGRLKAEIEAEIPDSDKDKYTEASWNDYQTALKAAKEVNADADAVQREIDAALQALVKAKESLKPATATQEKLPYEDVKESDWFYKEAAYVYKHKLMTGKNETTFAPYENLVRAQFAVVLHRIDGTPAGKGDVTFPDVAEGEWYADAVLWAAGSDVGVITGYTDTGRFGPNDNITREQMAVMMYRYAKFKDYSVEKEVAFDSFNDAKSVQEFAIQAMRWAVGNKIITGKDNGTRLDPQGNTSRAECAIIIQRFMELYH